MGPDSPPLLRPTPRRPFDLNLTNATPPDTSTNPSPASEPTNPNLLDAKNLSPGGADTPSFSRTRSILNLTSSTLFGIYSPTGYNTEREEPTTPWGTGAETPRTRTGSLDGHTPAAYGKTAPRLHQRRSSQHVPQTPLPNYLLNLAFRIVLLFTLGMGYGTLVTHLHNDQKLAPFQVEGIIKPSYDWRYLVFWGVCGVGLGSLLPWVDMLWEDTDSDISPLSLEKDRIVVVEEDGVVSSGSGLGADWNPVVRSIGAFVGIAFAIVSLTTTNGAEHNNFITHADLPLFPQRKLPWASTLQVSLTLALVNPVLWYLIDRSKPGFLLSAAVGLLGTLSLLLLNPEMMPAPATSSNQNVLYSGDGHGTNGTGVHTGNRLMGGLVAQETVECGTWIISVLFCSCVCFGNIGRMLALKGQRRTVRS